MRFVTKVVAALALVTAQAPGDSGLAASNCGFLTIEQCRATISGMGGFCEPNQFYNPQGRAKGPGKRGVRAYDPYPWCADYSDGGR